MLGIYLSLSPSGPIFFLIVVADVRVSSVSVCVYGSKYPLSGTYAY